MNFVAIDFETATGYRNSACAVGIVTIENGTITDEYHALIQPPQNEYWGQNIAVHGITSSHTRNAPLFPAVYPEIRRRLRGKTVVAHNESFDRSVLKRTMEHYGLSYAELAIADKWECTLRIFRAKGFQPATLNACCSHFGISLNHHEALSDARGCALLFLRR